VPQGLHGFFILSFLANEEKKNLQLITSLEKAQVKSKSICQYLPAKPKMMCR
jgi:hypothetical protein